MSINFTGVSTHFLITLAAAVIGFLIGSLTFPFTFAPALLLSSFMAGGFFAREASQVIDNDHWDWLSAVKAVFSSLDVVLQGMLPAIIPIGILFWMLVI